MVPDPLGPEMGMDRSAVPDSFSTCTFPLNTNASLMGVPRADWTASFALALATASLYTSDDLIAPKTTARITVIRPPHASSGVRHPTGMTHFQLRLHQLRFAG